MDALKRQVDAACRHLLSEQHRDPHAPTWGCFDRRYWAWKLVDYPEATFQRNVYPLAWRLTHVNPEESDLESVLTQAVQAGLQFAVRLQHKDGSFDQAFPNEHSFGATAFLLTPVLRAFKIIRPSSSATWNHAVEASIRRAADFLCGRAETHGRISNHIAGAVLALMESASLLQDLKYEHRASDLLQHLLRFQSQEGWFVEYDGADPGYQTLCLYYLAQVYRLRPTLELKSALERAISFLSYFAHPDGTFGGEYGSRRTAIFYPGGLALLSREFPLAHSLTRFMLKSIAEGRTVTLGDVDMGNFAPLVENYIAALQAEIPDQPASPLPCEQVRVCQDLAEAGLYVRGTRRYYAILGTSNGGVLKVFDRDRRAPLWDDSGYVGELSSGKLITTQMTDLTRPCRSTPIEIEFETPFFHMLRSTPSPFQFVVLRVLNLTLMHSSALREWVKKLLVHLLIRGKRRAPLELRRHIRFESEQIRVTDTLQTRGKIALHRLEYGRPFVAIHMASANYFQGAAVVRPACSVDIEPLEKLGEVKTQVTI